MNTAAQYRRIKFEDLELKRLPNSRCTSRVVLVWQEGSEFVGTSEGFDSENGVLRCVAQAAAEALELAVGKTVSLELLGVTSIKAFDAVVVVVALSSRISDHVQRIVGSAVIDGQACRATVHAVLSATNRLLGDNLIYLR